MQNNALNRFIIVIVTFRYLKSDFISFTFADIMNYLQPSTERGCKIKNADSFLNLQDFKLVFTKHK